MPVRVVLRPSSKRPSPAIAIAAWWRQRSWAGGSDGHSPEDVFTWSGSVALALLALAVSVTTVRVRLDRRHKTQEGRAGRIRKGVAAHPISYPKTGHGGGPSQSYSWLKPTGPEQH